jgi:hypothetical protein
MSEYENPATKGTGGDVSSPKVSGGANKSSYDDAANKSAGKQDSSKAKPAGGGGSKEGYDNVKKDQDFGFSGHGKKGKKLY